MDEHESTVKYDRKRLQEIFVSVTGETVITDRQDQEGAKEVINHTDSDPSPDEQRFDADSAANGLEDKNGDPESE